MSTPSDQDTGRGATVCTGLTTAWCPIHQCRHHTPPIEEEHRG